MKIKQNCKYLKHFTTLYFKFFYVNTLKAFVDKWHYKRINGILSLLFLFLLRDNYYYD